MEVIRIKILSCCASFSSSHDSELEKDAPTKKLDDDEVAFDYKYAPTKKFDDDDDYEVSFDNKHTPSKKSDEHEFTTNNAGFGKFIF
jgi:queuine tRNA-ribosyltransferase